MANLPDTNVVSKPLRVRRLQTISPEIQHLSVLSFAELGTLPRLGSPIAATALHHDLRLVTRKVAYFQVPGLQVINSWEFE